MVSIKSSVSFQKWEMCFTVFGLEARNAGNKSLLIAAKPE